MKKHIPYPYTPLTSEGRKSESQDDAYLYNRLLKKADNLTAYAGQRQG